MPEPPVGGVSGGVGAVGVPLPKLVTLKREVYDRYLEILSRAGYEQLARLGVQNAAEWNAQRPGLAALAQQRTDELFDQTFKTARGRARVALLDELSKNLKPQDAAVALRKRFRSVGRRQAYTAVATEVRDLVNLATLQAWQAIGMTHVRASDGHGGLTGRTDRTCVQRNGKVFPIDVALGMTTGRDPTVHPRCTLGWLPVVPRTGLSPTLAAPTGTGAAGTIILPQGVQLALPKGAWRAEPHPRWPAHTIGRDSHGHPLAGEYMRAGREIVDAAEALERETGDDVLDMSFLARGAHHITSVHVRAVHGQALLFSVQVEDPTSGRTATVGLAWLDGEQLDHDRLTHALELIDAGEPVAEIGNAIEEHRVASQVVATEDYRLYAQAVNPRNDPMINLFAIDKRLNSDSRSLKRAATRVLAAINTVHGQDAPPSAKKIPLLGDPNLEDDGMLSTYSGGDPIEILVNPNGDFPHLTVAHEIGHYIDRQIMGRNFFASDPGLHALTDTEMVRLPDDQTPTMDRNVAHVLDAIRDSDAFQRLDQMFHQREPTIIERFGEPYPVMPNRGYVQYNMFAWELFARAYSQYIALRSGDPDLIHDHEQWQEGSDFASVVAASHGIHYPRQWEWPDFAPIAAAMDDLFDSKNLLRPGARGSDPAGLLKPEPLAELPPGVRYNPDLPNEATNRGTHIEVGPKFRALTPDQQRGVLAHEMGHYADEHWLRDPNSWVWDENEWKDADGVILNGPTSTPGERIADAIGAIITGDQESIDRWPAIQRIRDEMGDTPDTGGGAAAPGADVSDNPYADPSSGWERFYREGETEAMFLRVGDRITLPEHPDRQYRVTKLAVVDGSGLTPSLQAQVFAERTGPNSWRHVNDGERIELRPGRTVNRVRGNPSQVNKIGDQVRAQEADNGRYVRLADNSRPSSRGIYRVAGWRKIDTHLADGTPLTVYQRVLQDKDGNQRLEHMDTALQYTRKPKWAVQQEREQAERAARNTPTDLSAPEYAALSDDHRQVLQGMLYNQGEAPGPAAPIGTGEVTPRDRIVANNYLHALGQMPVPLLQMLKDAGVKVYMGAGLEKITDLDEQQHAENEQPRGWTPGSKMWQVGGYYTPGRGWVFVGNGKRDGSRSVLLHELGHAIGDKMRVDDNPDLRAHHARLKAGLNPYYSGAAHATSRDPDRAGRQELWAEAVAVYLAGGDGDPVDTSPNTWETAGFLALVNQLNGIGTLDAKFAAYVEDKLRALAGLQPITRPPDALLDPAEKAQRQAKLDAIHELEAAPLNARIGAGRGRNYTDYYLRVPGGWQLWTHYDDGREVQVAERTIPSAEIATWFAEGGRIIEVRP